MNSEKKEELDKLISAIGEAKQNMRQYDNTPDTGPCNIDTVWLHVGFNKRDMDYVGKATDTDISRVMRHIWVIASYDYMGIPSGIAKRRELKCEEFAQTLSNNGFNAEVHYELD